MFQMKTKYVVNVYMMIAFCVRCIHTVLRTYLPTIRFYVRDAVPGRACPAGLRRCECHELQYSQMMENKCSILNPIGNRQ